MSGGDTPQTFQGMQNTMPRPTNSPPQQTSHAGARVDMQAFSLPDGNAVPGFVAPTVYAFVGVNETVHHTFHKHPTASASHWLEPPASSFTDIGSAHSSRYHGLQPHYHNHGVKTTRLFDDQSLSADLSQAPNPSDVYEDKLLVANMPDATTNGILNPEKTVVEMPQMVPEPDQSRVPRVVMPLVLRKLDDAPEDGGTPNPLEDVTPMYMAKVARPEETLTSIMPDTMFDSADTREATGGSFSAPKDQISKTDYAFAASAKIDASGLNYIPHLHEKAVVLLTAVGPHDKFGAPGSVMSAALAASHKLSPQGVPVWTIILISVLHTFFNGIFGFH